MVDRKEFTNRLIFLEDGTREKFWVVLKISEGFEHLPSWVLFSLLDSESKKRSKAGMKPKELADELWCPNKNGVSNSNKSRVIPVISHPWIPLIHFDTQSQSFEIFIRSPDLESLGGATVHSGSSGSSSISAELSSSDSTELGVGDDGQTDFLRSELSILTIGGVSLKSCSVSSSASGKCRTGQDLYDCESTLFDTSPLSESYDWDVARPAAHDDEELLRRMLTSKCCLFDGKISTWWRHCSSTTSPDPRLAESPWLTWWLNSSWPESGEWGLIGVVNESLSLRFDRLRRCWPAEGRICFFSYISYLRCLAMYVSSDRSSTCK